MVESALAMRSARVLSGTEREAIPGETNVVYKGVLLAFSDNAGGRQVQSTLALKLCNWHSLVARRQIGRMAWIEDRSSKPGRLLESKASVSGFLISCVPRRVGLSGFHVPMRQYKRLTEGLFRNKTSPTHTQTSKLPLPGRGRLLIGSTTHPVALEMCRQIGAGVLVQKFSNSIRQQVN